MRQVDAVVVVGATQDGAHLLRTAMSRLRPQLRGQGVSYLDDTALATFGHLRGCAASPDPDEGQTRAFEHELAAAVSAERRHASRRSDSSVVLLYAEHLLGPEILGRGDGERFRPRAVPALTQVIRSIGATDARIVLHTRRQDRLMELAYLHEIATGRHHRFRDQFPYANRPALDYGSLLDRIGAVAGVREVVVRPVESLSAGADAWVADVLGAAGLAGRFDVSAATADLALQRSYTRRGLRIAMALNPHLETDEDRIRVREYLLKDFGTRQDAQSRFLAAARRDRILAAYDEANRRMFRRYRPDLPEDGYAGDAQTDGLADLATSGEPVAVHGAGTAGSRPPELPARRWDVARRRKRTPRRAR